MVGCILHHNLREPNLGAGCRLCWTSPGSLQHSQLKFGPGLAQPLPSQPPSAFSREKGEGHGGTGADSAQEWGRMGSSRGAPCGSPVCSLSAGQMLLLQHLKLLFDTRTYQVTRTPLPCQDGAGAFKAMVLDPQCLQLSAPCCQVSPWVLYLGRDQVHRPLHVHVWGHPGWAQGWCESCHLSSGVLQRQGHIAPCRAPFLPITTTAAPCPKRSSLGAGPKPSPTSAETLCSLPCCLHSV